MNFNSMSVISVALLLVVIAQQGLDFWTTWKVLSLGGRERNFFVAWVMARIGVVPALALLKGIVSAACVWAVSDDWPGSIELAGTMAFIVLAYGWVLWGNFKALKQQRSIAAGQGSAV